MNINNVDEYADFFTQFWLDQKWVNFESCRLEREWIGGWEWEGCGWCGVATGSLDELL